MALTRLVHGVLEQILPEVIIILLLCEIDGLLHRNKKEKLAMCT